MPIGPGKYDAEATTARESTRAKGILLAVIEGNRGNGFSVQADLATTLRLPSLLRQMADDIEKSLRAGMF